MSLIVSSVAASLFSVPWIAVSPCSNDEARDLAGHRCADGRLAERALVVSQRGRGLIDLVMRRLGGGARRHRGPSGAARSARPRSSRALLFLICR